MVDITYKVSTHRKAVAQAIVRVSSLSSIEAIRNKEVPKGDVFEMARVAAMFAAKRTSDMVPDCHPLPIEYVAVRYDINELAIYIEVEVHTIYKTGVEVEAMHAASVAALTMYDMLKPIDKEIVIEHIKLLRKEGGKRDFTPECKRVIRSAIIICSDSVFHGRKDDEAGKIVKEKLEANKIHVEGYKIIPDDFKEIQATVKLFVDQHIDIVILSGGTGLTARDTTPEAIKEMLDISVPGIEEAIRNYGIQRTPHAMFSRCVAGMIGKTLVLALPGSKRGAKESMEAIFPFVLHIFR